MSDDYGPAPPWFVAWWAECQRAKAAQDTAAWLADFDARQRSRDVFEANREAIGREMGERETRQGA